MFFTTNVDACGNTDYTLQQLCHNGAGVLPEDGDTVYKPDGTVFVGFNYYYAISNSTTPNSQSYTAKIGFNGVVSSKASCTPPTTTTSSTTTTFANNNK